MAEQVARGPALGLLELSLVARGVLTADALVKRAEVELVASRPVSGGKHLVILAGGVEEVGEAMSAVRAADAAGKAAPVALRDMQLAVGISGKAFFTMTGDLADIEAACAAARDAAGKHLLALEVIASPAAEVVGRLIF